MRTYLFTFCLSMLISMGLTPLVIEFARRKKLHDLPNARSIHADPIPRLGGIVIFIPTILVTLFILLVPNTIGQAFRGVYLKILVILAAASIMFVTGMFDDYKGIRIRTKFAAQVLAAVMVCMAGVHFQAIGVQGLFTIQFGWFGFFLTVFWIVGVTNAVNFIDGLDGLAAGISCIACITIAGLSVYNENRILAVLMLAMSGSLVGFLFFNFSPAKIFMGDCGSLFLGFIIASSAVLAGGKTDTLVGFALPVLVLGIPLFDAFFCMLRRFLQRRGMTSADRGHFHHRLLDLGFSQHHVAVIAYLITLVMAGLGFLMIAARSTASVVIFIGCLLLLLLVFRIIGSIRLRETLSAIKTRSDFARTNRIDRKIFEQIQLHFNNAEDFNDWWQACELAADKLGFMEIKLPLNSRQGKQRILEWKKPFSEKSQSIQMNIPIVDRRKDSNLKMQISVHKDGSLESASRRATLFTRLMEENGIASLK